MKKVISSKDFIKNLEISLIVFSIISCIFIFLIWKNLAYTLSFISGIFIAYLNFRSTKNESFSTLNKVKQGLDPEKGALLYISKFYLRLLATGFVLYFFIKILKLNPIFILLGLGIIYFQLILIALKDFYFKKIEIY